MVGCTGPLAPAACRVEALQVAARSTAAALSLAVHGSRRTQAAAGAPVFVLELHARSGPRCRVSEERSGACNALCRCGLGARDLPADGVLARRSQFSDANSSTHT